MKIAIISSESKKELVAEICVAYCGILNNHSLCSTSTIGQYLGAATGLKFDTVSFDEHGGLSQIQSKITYNEIDLLLYFRDPCYASDYDTTKIDLIRVCDENMVPVATNVASAEALLLALQRGDLDWRENFQNIHFN
jgi:methylglyoxal synthase